MKNLSIGQRKSLAEFFTNAAVAWLTVGVISPFFDKKALIDFIISNSLGIMFTAMFLLVSLYFMKGVRS